MKDNVSQPVMIAVIVVVVVILGFIGWQVFGAHNQTVDPAQSAIIKARKQDKG